MVKRYVVTEEPDEDETTFSLELGPVYTGDIPSPPGPAGPAGYPIYALLPHTAYKVTRTIFPIFSGKAAANLIPLATPPLDFRPLISVLGGTDNTGDITVSGLQDGVAKSEKITFTGPASKDCTILLDTLTSIVTEGLADEGTIPDVVISAMDTQSAPILEDTLTAIQVRFENKITSYESSPGLFSKSEARIFSVDTSLVIGDLIQYLGKKYQVRNILIRSNLDGVEAFRVFQLGAFQRGR